VADIGSRIVELREAHDLTRLELAKKLGLNKSSIARYENGVIRPDLDVLLKIKSMFNVSLDWLVGDDINKDI
jgi:transcriptional regulator with XRE-family HTH domain